MLESLLASLVIAQTDYVYLTTANKSAVERRISDIRVMADPQIEPGEISSILGIQPTCGKKNSQIQCTWSEGNRKIQAFWSAPWKFQRWDSTGF
ncbi:hypothetical protein V0288_09265 [Pannus brasiliensis CCIBt3594]|uniref:Uncharacterized protein n=1 Tax=Pannus brasiliensis CCIBt3594 TaxID=1427578 RepID=A0AAW9QSU2_9CHRO